MSKDSIICWGEVLWDMFPHGPQLGGAVANVAFHLGQLGARVRLVSRVGDDELGHRAIARLQDAGVDTSLVQIDLEHPTGQVHVELEDGEPRYSLSSGGAWERIELTAAAAAALDTCQLLCVGTLAQRLRQGREALDQALASARDCRLLIDANVRPVHLDLGWLEQVLHRADIVKVNEAEAELLERELAKGEPLGWLHAECAIDLVALTRGARGCLLSGVDERAEHRGFVAEEGGDNVGAGDAFVAVLAYGLCQGRPLTEIAERANLYAAFVAGRKGATPTPSAELVARVVG